MKRTYQRGEMYYANLGRGVGSEQEGRRPVVIIQNDVGNKHSPTVIVAAITTKTAGKRKLPTHYEIGTEHGMKASSLVLLEQIRTIDKHRLEKKIGKLSPKQIKELNHALAVSVGLIDPKPKTMTLCLCHTCVENFFSTGAYYLKRVVHTKQRKKPVPTAISAENLITLLERNERLIVLKKLFHRFI